jgi:two-component system, cell cycle sensor histidine kinase and response regulator CckA
MDKDFIANKDNVESANDSPTKEFLIEELRKANEHLKREIEERIKGEEELRRTKDFLQGVIDSIPVPMAVKDRDHRWILINKIISDIFQKPREELLGKTDHDIIRKEEADIFRAKEIEVFTTGQPNINEEMFTDANGCRRWQVAEKKLFSDTGGNQYLLAISYDVTARKAAEEELRNHRERLEELVEERTKELVRINEQLVQSQKMEAIGQLAGGISHEFNNILAIILGTADVFKNNTPPDNPNYERVDRIIRVCNRAKSLTSRLLVFARNDNLDIRFVSIQSILADFVDIMKSGISKKIVIKTSCPDKEIAVKVDLNLITHALMNICNNACDAMKNGGELSIEVSTARTDENFFRAHPELKPRKYCRIEIKDTGAGIPACDINKIFEPFFTTKDKSEGTGLGLSVTMGIVKMHSGAIEVESKPGKGTNIKIFLPAEHHITDSEEQESADEPLRGNGENVLVIDDVEDFLDMMAELLYLQGYKPITAKSGVEALQKLSKNPGKYDLVILDLMMPGMDGGDVFDEIRKIRPDLKIIICTGYNSKEKHNAIMDMSANAIIPKPFEEQQFYSIVYNAIHS